MASKTSKPSGARYVAAETNPDGALFIPGIPLRDLSAEEFAALPEHMQRSIIASPLYDTGAAPVLALPKSDAAEASKE